MVHSAGNAPLALTKILMALMKTFALLALWSFFQIVQISYMYEEESVRHLALISAYLRSIECPIAIPLLRS